jgi:glutathione S-transferase
MPPDSFQNSPTLFPPADPERWRGLRLQALGDANVSRRNKLRRPRSEQSAGWLARQTHALQAALDWLESHFGDLEGPITTGSVTIACALGYFEVRFPSDDWRQGHPKLSEWFDRFSLRPSMQETRYTELKKRLPRELQKEGGLH